MGFLNITSVSEFCYSTCRTDCQQKEKNVCGPVPKCQLKADAGCVPVPSIKNIRQDNLIPGSITKKRCTSYPDFLTDSWLNDVCHDVTKPNCDWKWVIGAGGDKVKQAINCKDDTHRECNPVCETKKQEFSNWGCEEFQEDDFQVVPATVPATFVNTICTPEAKVVCDTVEECQVVKFTECSQRFEEQCIHLTKVESFQAPGDHLTYCPKNGCKLN